MPKLLKAIFQGLNYLKRIWIFLKSKFGNVKSSRNKQSSITKLLISLIIYALGVLTSPFIVEKFAKLIAQDLEINASISGMIGTKEQDGCIFYVLSLINSEEPIDYLYIRMQFPSKINDYEIGIPVSGFNENGTDMNAQMWAAYKDSNNCLIRKPAEQGLGNIQVDVVGNMITIQASRLRKGDAIFGMIGVNKEQSFINPKPKFSSNCFYEITKLGTRVEKEFKLLDKGHYFTKK
tara:strand:- start:17532 stop:18236 length:705 start_codon:yes stop_codon:yes gene_type:complete